MIEKLQRELYGQNTNATFNSIIGSPGLVSCSPSQSKMSSQIDYDDRMLHGVSPEQLFSSDDSNDNKQVCIIIKNLNINYN